MKWYLIHQFPDGSRQIFVSKECLTTEHYGCNGGGQIFSTLTLFMTEFEQKVNILKRYQEMIF